MHRFLVDRCRPGGEVRLPGAESRHAAGSLRLEPGARVVLFDGAGGEWDGEIVRTEDGRVVVRAGAPRPVAPVRAFSIATAVPKGSRLDWMVEKLAELGVAEVLPVRFRRSIASISEAKRARLERIAGAAAKQSGRSTLPIIAAEIDLGRLLERVGSRTRIARPGAPGTLAASGPASMVVVGPEGEMTGDEEKSLLDAGASPVSLGPHVLRIETAAVAAAAVLAEL